MYKASGSVIVGLTLAATASAHHGFGRFDPSREIELEGTVTGIDFVNPHAYFYFDAIADDGSITPMRCEMRAATVLRRSGWSPDMFVDGSHVVVNGRPHRDDPASCYIETVTLGDAPTIERYQQFETDNSGATQERSARLASGEPNIFGDWAQEQYLIARSPGGRGGLVPKSMVAGVEAGTLTMADVPDAAWGARPVTFTDAGEAAVAATRAVAATDAPSMQCEVTSVLFDWVFDGPINRISRDGDTVKLEYGRGLTRTVHMDMETHPAGIEPSRAGHSIGSWDGDTFVVDTARFEPGLLTRGVPHSDALHLVERFTLETDTNSLVREYVAEDPRFFASEYAGSDIVKPADAPFAVDPCEELTYVNYAEEAAE